MVDSIIGHWKLNEASGTTANDSTSHGNHATVTGTSVETGLFNNARVFYPETDNRIVVGNQTMFDFGSDNFTVSVWIKQAVIPASSQGILSKWDAVLSDGYKSWRIATHTDGTIHFDTSSDGYATNQFLSSPGVVVDGKWHLITVSRAGALYKLFVDGGLSDKNLFGPTTLSHSTAPLTFGNYSEASYWDSSFDGYLDNVRVYNYEMTEDEVSELYYNTGYDRFPPWFQVVSPAENETMVMVDEPIVFKYIDENTDLNTLFVEINNFRAITLGIPRDGYSATYEYFSDGLSDGYDGYIVTVDYDNWLPPRKEIVVDLSARDAYGNLGEYSYSFFTASDVDPPPTFDNLNPPPGAIGLTPSSSIFFQFNDGYDTGPDLISGADLSSLLVTVNGITVIDGGVFQAGYSGSTVENVFDGYDVTITKDLGWDVAHKLNIELHGNDYNGTFNSLGYKLKVGGGPVIIDEFPADLSYGIIATNPTGFTVRDAEYGIDQSGVDATINGAQAILNGIGANNHIIVYNEVEDGYDIIIGHDVWTEFSYITVNAQVENRNSDSSGLVYAFRTQDISPPIINPLIPRPNSERVNINTDLEIDLTDGYSGIDAYSLDLSINGQDAVIDGVAQPGFGVTYATITDGYKAVVSKDTALPEMSIISVYAQIFDWEANQSEVSYTFATDDVTDPVITNQVPENGSSALPISPVTFDIHDRHGSGTLPNNLNVTIESVPAIVDGYFQPGFTGSVIFDLIDGYDGYHVSVSPDVLFDWTTVVDVSIDIKDAYGFSASSNYSFTIDDIFEPVIAYLDPAASGISSLRPYVSFKIHDSGGTGVDDTMLDVTLDGVSAIIGGVVTPTFEGDVYPATVDSFDGYAVWFRSPVRFGPSTVHDVVIDGYDIYDNWVHLEYQFTTTDDTTIPTFELFDPYPGEIAVDRDTSIFFEFNDNDGSIWVSNINTLNVSINDVDAIQDGYAVNGHFVSIVQNVNDGYDITIQPPTTLPEFRWIPVEIDGYDEADNFGTYYYDFRTADETNPIIQNLVPDDGQIHVPTNTDISFDVIDGYSGINLDSIYVTIDGKVAVNNGAPVTPDGYGLTVVPIVDGYTISVSGSNLNEWDWADIFISVEDVEDNLITSTYSFFVEDVTSPDIKNISPAEGSLNVDNHVEIKFDYIDQMSGPDLNGLTVLANGDPLVLSGAPAPGIILSTNPITNGYHIEIAELVFVEGQEIEIEIDGYDLSGNRVFVEYFLTGAFVRPQYQNMDPPPDTIAVPLDADVSFEVVDAYGIDLSTLDMFIDSDATILDGVVQDGYSATFVEITDGYRITLSFNELLEEMTVKNIEIYCEDFNGISGTTSYYFKTWSHLAPIFVDITPPPLIGHEVENIIVDGYEFDGYIFDGYVFDGYIPDDGYDGYDGYNLDGYGAFWDAVWVPSYLPTYRMVSHTETHIEYPPIFESEDEDIKFRIRDPIGNGIIPGSIEVHINGYPAVVAGEARDGYSVEILSDEDGYIVTVGHERFDPYSRVYVNLFATNLDGQSSEFYYFYNTGEKSFPDVINQNPAPYSTGAPRDGYLCFDVVDYTDVDFGSIEIRVNDELAFTNGEFVPGFDGIDSFHEPIYIYEERHFPDIIATWAPEYRYWPPVYYSYEEYYQDAYWDGYQEVIISDGYRTIDGYYDGYSELIGYNFDGYIDDGYDAYVDVDTVGYRFCVDKINPYRFAEVVNVDVYACDTLGNCGTRSYYFTVESETGPPVFEPIYPLPSEQDVLLDSDIAFRVNCIQGNRLPWVWSSIKYA